MVFETRRVLVQMRAIEKNVFAKVEELRKLAEKMGELTAFHIAQLWRLPPEDPERVRLEERDRLAVMLKQMGIDESRVQERTARITEMVTRDLVQHVWEAVARQIFSEGPAKGMDDTVRKKL